jgi:hypothetical protein
MSLVVYTVPGLVREAGVSQGVIERAIVRGEIKLIEVRGGTEGAPRIIAKRVALEWMRKRAASKQKSAAVAASR